MQIFKYCVRQGLLRGNEIVKKSLSIVSVLLICLLALSTTQVFFGNYASASTCAANFLPNFFWAYVGDVELDTLPEITLSEATANYIVSVLDQYPHYDYRNSSCSANTFLSTLPGLQSYDNAVIYSKGHLAWQWFDGNEHHGLCMHDGNTSQVWDYEIYPLTSSKNVNTFIWHCKTGLIPTEGPNPDTCGIRGLPIAFTHNTGIGALKWGSSGSQVYLGWTDEVPQYNYPLPQGGSPQYTWNINYNYNYAQVAALYYYYVGQGYSTIDALDELSETIYGAGNDYGSVVLHDWLVYFGNRYIGLP